MRNGQTDAIAAGAPAVYGGVVERLANDLGESVLARLLLDVEKSGVCEALPGAGRGGVERFLERLGWLAEGAAPGAANGVVEVVAESVERSPAVVSILFRVYADGLYGRMPDGVCGNPPRCRNCPLTRACRYYNAPPGSRRPVRSASPTERLRSGGAEALSGAELLELVAGGGRVREADRATVRALLERYGSLRRLARASLAELESFAAVGRWPAVRLAASLALGARVAAESRRPGQTMRCGADFHSLYHEELRDLEQEVFLVVLLDQRHRVLREHRVSVGTLTETLVHPREVFAPAIREAAAAVAVVHNHPSGDPAPSREDKEVTARLRRAAEVLGIRLLDHVIVGEGRYTSFVELGLL